MAEIPVVRKELADDVSKLRDILVGIKSKEEFSEYYSSAEDEYSSDEDYECAEDENASGSSSGQYIVPDSSPFPNSLENLRESTDRSLELCLALNMSYRKRIFDAINEVKEMLEKNRERQRKLMEERTESSEKEKSGSTKMIQKAYKAKCFEVFEAPYFRDIRGQFAPPNEDAITKQRNKELTAYVVPLKTWSDAEKKSLERAVALNSKEKLMTPLLIRKQMLTEKLQNKNLSEAEYEVETKKLEEVNEKINKFQETPDEQCIGPRGADIDWMKISAVGLDGSRTPEECKLMWDNEWHPSINKENWSEEENKTLWGIAQRHNFHDWDTITTKLKTNRTSWQCLRQYQQKLKRTYLCGPWSKSEDEILKRVVEACRAGDYIPWHQVSYYLEGRTRTQIQNRWERCLCPDLRKGAWTLDEDLILISAVKKHGTDWTKVCKYLPGRNNTQCRERYKNTLEDSITFAEWTQDEDLKLLQLVKKYGEGKWAMIAQEMNGRLDNAVYQRFRLLKSKRPDILDHVDPEVIPDASILPSIISQPGQCSKATKRRQEVHEALKSRNIKLENPERKAVESSHVKPAEELFQDCLQLMNYRRVVRGHRKKKTQREGAVDSAIDAFLAPMLSLTAPFARAKYLSMTGVECMQAAVAKYFLFRLFKCGSERNDDIDIPERDFKQFKEMKEEIDEVFRHLVVGTNCEGNDCIPVIPPNRSTMFGFKVALTSRKRLIMSARIIKDISIISILTSRSLNSVQCLDCLEGQDLKEESSHDLDENPKTLMEDTPPPNKERRRIDSNLDEKNGAPVQSLDRHCDKCERLSVFRADFHLLKMRFLATFLWPALLSTLEPTKEEDEDALNENEIADEENSQRSKKYYQLRKRRHKKPWVTELLKKRHLELQHVVKDETPQDVPKKRRGKYNKAAKNLPPTRRSMRCATKAVTNA